MAAARSGSLSGSPLVFVLAGVAALRISWRFILRSALAVVSVTAALLAMVAAM
jgi:hypothetical protein